MLKTHLVEARDWTLPGLKVVIDFSHRAVAAVISQKVDGHVCFVPAADRNVVPFVKRGTVGFTLCIVQILAPTQNAAF